MAEISEDECGIPCTAMRDRLRLPDANSPGVVTARRLRSEISSLVHVYSSDGRSSPLRPGAMGQCRRQNRRSLTTTVSALTNGASCNDYGVGCSAHRQDVPGSPTLLLQATSSENAFWLEWDLNRTLRHVVGTREKPPSGGQLVDHRWRRCDVPQ